MRHDKRSPEQLRPVTMERGVAKFAEGSCLIKIGETHMHVTATVDEGVPRFKKGSGEGWLTAEYSMLPRSGRQRNQRDLMKPNGRTMEIQRLIARALRASLDLTKLGERTITLDCDAIQADGGTRCAAITAGYVALMDAVQWMIRQRMITRSPVIEPLAAVSVGIVNGEPVLDLDYAEDSTAGTDMNVVMTASGKFIEIQGTAEHQPFSAETLAKMLRLGKIGCDELMALQRATLE